MKDYAKDCLLIVAYHALYAMILIYIMDGVLARKEYEIVTGAIALSMLKLIGRLTEREDDE